MAEFFDSLAFAVFIYIVISTSLISMLPNSFFTGAEYDYGTYPDSVNLTTDEDQNFATQVSFMSKISSFLFYTWDITGIPAIMGTILAVLNYITFFIIGTWLYKNLRGN